MGPTMHYIQLTLQITKEGNAYSSICKELDIASCGDSIEEARDMLIEAIECTLEGQRDLGQLDAYLKAHGVKVQRHQRKRTEPPRIKMPADGSSFLTTTSMQVA